MEKLINKSVSEIEGWKWKGDIPTPETHGGIECRFYALHNVPLVKLDLADIRFLLGQNSGLNELVPYVIDKLRENIFIEVEYYSGDLLCSLLLINNEPNYWKSHIKEKEELIEIYNEQKKNLGTINEDQEIIQKIKDAYKEFVNS